MMWPQFLGKEGGLIRGGLLYWNILDLWLLSTIDHSEAIYQ